ncbi:potassium-transporting ATPase subunit KdpC [Buttiauxella sp. WJP83]|uniref:Potassium-transporting ATPase KdpC subunit n=1 Tax=Buttiauxella selenatireducens TaxID=3073902 RepID=A0ABY9S832_9ENTR|nr:MULTISPECIES: potassium-transporting ATPase subunit KdpC [unclassified Buttiauxella]WBM69573.1 potassium-transporting ATPase subunit KdpC [Buttiauxella sp. WJP83]WMY73250.1 potassium-transporting ATPase subunit KdpC [Buttiauxella sp. R73]GDX05881.1 potassium-transporting ATPase subunit KdpC [Buttiauxella sp. A111]
MTTLRPAILLLILLTLITGGLYPLLTTLLGQWWFPAQANGSLILDTNVVRGSSLIGQNFTQPTYLQGRPSATAETPYNPMASGGSNLAGSNPELDKVITERVAALRAANPQANPAVPVDLITASASGLDGQISPEAAAWQIPRIAKARHLPVEQVTRLVAENTTQPLVGFIGKPVVNVLLVNRALDDLQSHPIP